MQKAPQAPAQPIQPTPARVAPAQPLAMDDIAAAQLERIASALEAMVGWGKDTHQEQERQTTALEGIWGRLEEIEKELAAVASVMSEVNWGRRSE